MKIDFKMVLVCSFVTVMSSSRFFLNNEYSNVIVFYLQITKVSTHIASAV